MSEVDPKSVFDLRFTEGSATATITATIDRTYSQDVTVTLSTGGTATVTEDYDLSSTTITISAGSTTGTSTVTIIDDALDEDDKDTVRIEVASSTYALETVDQKILLAIEDNDDMPGVTLAASSDTIPEAGGTSNLTATLSTVSGRDVTIGLVMQGTAGSKDFTVGGDEIDISEVLTDSLVLNYSFSGNANDGTLNANDGTVSGATLTTDRFGEANSAYYFDGDGDHISVPLSSSLQIEEDITLNVWVKREESDYWTDFVVRAPGEYYEIRLDQRDNNTRFEAYGRGTGSWDHVGSGAHIDNGEWVMLSFTSTSETDTSGYTNKKNFKFYVNGELRNSYTRTGNRFNLNTNENLMIGSNQNGDNNNFKGSMDEVRIYNKALSDEEIGSLYNNTSVQKVNATISIPKGSTSGTIEVKGTDDQTDENDETLLSKIISTTGATETGDQKATIVILDDDNTTVSLTASSTTITEGKDDYTTVKVTLDKASVLPVTVKFKFSGVDSTDFLMKQEATLISGENVTWLPSSWGQGEPNNSGGEDHAHLTNGSTSYNDIPENSTRRHILELPYETTQSLVNYEYKGQYNGHSYYLSSSSTQSGWNDAKASTEAIEGGHLVVISTEEELTFIRNNVSNNNDWIGFYQDKSSSSYSEPLGGWTWVNTNYNPEVGEVVVPVGSTEASVYVFAEDDAVMGEPDETMKLEFEEITNGIAGSEKEVEITIKDNDVLPNVTLSLDGSELTEGGSDFSTLTATLSVATTQAVSVKLSSTGDVVSDDFRFSDDTLSIESGGLFAHYTFDGNAQDVSGNENHGVYVNATLTEDRFGVSNSDYLLNGSNNVIEAQIDNSNQDILKDELSISIWVRRDGDGSGTPRIISNGDNRFFLFDHQGGERFSARHILEREYRWSGSNKYADGEWSHIVFTSKRNTSGNNDGIFRIFQDGVLVRDYVNWASSNNWTLNDKIYFGNYSRNGNDWFKGAVDDVRIYNKFLTNSEVEVLYSKESEGSDLNTIVIPAGSTSAVKYVYAEDDAVMGESDEKLTVSIETVTNGNKASTSTSVEVTIKDNDVKPDVTLSGENTTNTINEGFANEGTGKYSKLTANLSVATTQPVTVNLSASGTASSSDYRLSSDTLNVTNSGLVAYYDFDGDANDESGNSNNGTITNATLTADRHGNSNKAYSFDGNNSYVEIPWTGSIRVEGDITMSVWLNIKDKENNYSGGYGRIIRAPSDYYEMWVNWNNSGVNNRSVYARSGGQGISLSSNENILEETWNHVVYTYTSDTLRIYVNGSEVSKQFKNWDWNNSLPGSGNLYIGAYGPNNNTFLGSLDDVRIYERALSATEISALYSVESESSEISSIVVPSGQTSNYLYVRPVDDAIYEVTETLKLSISSVDNGQAASSGTEVNFEIDDNEATPKVTLTSNKEFIGESEEFKSATITATSSQVSQDTIFVVLEASGSGTKDTDYELSSDSVLILPGATSGTITITAKWLSENDPTEGLEDVTLSIGSVTNGLEDGTQQVKLDITETSCDSVDKELKGNIRDDMTLFELCSPYTVGGTGMRIKKDVTVTLEKNAVLNFINDDSKIQIEGTLIIKEGAIINMTNDSYIYTEDDGQLVIEGTASKRVTITGESWEKNSNNGSGPGIDLNSSVASTIKYADIINSNVNNWDYMVRSQDGSTIENSTISGGRYGIYLSNSSTLKNSKVHSFERYALLLNNSTSTGTEFYDNSSNNTNDPVIGVDNNSTLGSLRLVPLTPDLLKSKIFSEGFSSPTT